VLDVLLGVLAILLVVGSIAGPWWLLMRVLNGDNTLETGGSFGDQLLGERNTRKERKKTQKSSGN